MLLSRRGFVSTSAAAVSGAVLATNAQAAEPATPAHTPVHFHILNASEYDHASMMSTIAASEKNKQIFQTSATTLLAPGVASIYLHMQSTMNTFEFSYPKSVGPVATLGVLMGPAIVFALNDATWRKYKLGSAFQLAPTNEYYKASSNLDLSARPDDANGVYQDWSAQAIIKRGGAFMVCHNATTFVASVVASKSGLSPQAVLTDFKANLLPGFSLVPSGVGAVQLALENGWNLFQVG